MFIEMVALLLAGAPVAAQEMVKKIGDRCPQGYIEQFNQGSCKRSSSAAGKIIRKRGSFCPQGYIEQFNAGYCKRSSDSAGNVIRKIGVFCPQGYTERLNTGYCQEWSKTSGKEYNSKDLKKREEYFAPMDITKI